MKIFITGGTGFIGRHLIRELEGNQVLILARKRPLWASSTRAEWLIGDLRQTDLWESRLIEFSPEVCIHLAWDGLPDYSKEISENNVLLGMNLFSSLEKTALKKFVALGSCWEYGDFQGQALEVQGAKPENHFALAKVQAYEFFSDSCRRAGIGFVWPRLFFSFGPGQRDVALLPTVFNALEKCEKPTVKSPDSAQDFIYISDVARAIALTATLGNAQGIFNVGSGRLTQVGDFVNMISTEFGSYFRMSFSGTPKGVFASTDKLKNSTGWEPSFTVRQGVAETVKALRRNRN